MAAAPTCAAVTKASTTPKSLVMSMQGRREIHIVSCRGKQSDKIIFTILFVHK